MYTSDASGMPGGMSDPPEPSANWRDYTELKEMLKALGDNARLNIVHALSAGGEVKVTDLALRLAVSQPLVSWHLGILRRHGLVRQRRSGREVYCSLDRERFRRCERLLGELVAGSGGAGESSRPGATGPPRHEAATAERTPADRAPAETGVPPALEPAVEPAARPVGDRGRGPAERAERERADGPPRTG